jgi:hypothetical protein
LRLDHGQFQGKGRVDGLGLGSLPQLRQHTLLLLVISIL